MIHLVTGSYWVVPGQVTGQKTVKYEFMIKTVLYLLKSFHEGSTGTS